MANDDAQEKTQEATEKRKREAREKGQIARSRELNTLLVLLAGSGGLYLVGANIASELMNLMHYNFTFQRSDIFSQEALLSRINFSVEYILKSVMPFFLLVFIAALVAPMALGGWNFSLKSLAPKLEKISLFKGLKRMFSIKALIELAKALAKFSVVAIVAIAVLKFRITDFLSLSTMPIINALGESGYLVATSFLIISLTLIIVVLVDVPYQLWDHAKKMRMSHLEIKDEYKETEGKPEVKRKVRELQQKMAKNRMMQEVPKADVVVINPTHYSVALSYNPVKTGAPIVVAKGIDLIALQIRKVATHNQVPIIDAAPIARALYHTTDLQDEIPSGLYVAVAQILAYVYQLQRFESEGGEKPKMPNDFNLPEDLRY